MNEFKKGDKVRTDAGFIGEIDIYVVEPATKWPYRVSGLPPTEPFWYAPNQLALVAPATQAAPAAGDGWEVSPTERELTAYGDGYATGIKDAGGEKIMQLEQRLAAAGDGAIPTYEQLRAVIAADDPNGYSELLDELSGRIKRLERELAATRERLAAAEADNILYFRWLYSLMVALAKRCLAERNATSEPGEWPGGMEWHELVDTSRSIFLHAARDEAGINHEAFLERVRSGKYEVTDIYEDGAKALEQASD